MPDYVLEGPRWEAEATGGSVTVTWAVDENVPAAMVDAIDAAFSDWSAHANISFEQVASAADAQIKIGENYIDGLDNVLGNTNYYYTGSDFQSANIVFDSGENWQTTGGGGVMSGDGVDFFMVALHEIGHSLGLDHYNGGPAVMNSYIDLSINDLTGSDIDGIQALYGTASGTITMASGQNPVTTGPIVTASAAVTTNPAPDTYGSTVTTGPVGTTIGH